MRIIDGTDMIMGRLASYLAKELLNGEKVTIVNAEKVIISGNKKDICAKYKMRIDRTARYNPLKGPIFPRTPDGIVRRSIRGMVNFRSKRGCAAYKNLRVYKGVPKEFEGKAERLESYSAAKLLCSTMTVGDLSRQLGYNK